MKLVNITDCIIQIFHDKQLHKNLGVETQNHELSLNRLQPLLFLTIGNLCLVNSISLNFDKDDINLFYATRLGPCFLNIFELYSNKAAVLMCEPEELKDLQKSFDLMDFVSDYECISNSVVWALNITSNIPTEDLIKTIKNNTPYKYNDKLGIYDPRNESIDWNKFVWGWDVAMNEIAEELFNLNNKKYQTTENKQNDELSDFFNFAQKALDKKLNKPDDSIER